jgi:HSP20 family protein
MAKQTDLVPSARHRDLFDDLNFMGPTLFRRMLGDPWDNALRATRAEIPFPAIDIVENEKAYVVTSELAGCNRDDVSVEIHEGTLTIRGEKKSERSEENEQSRWTERTYGSFHRSFRLPADAASEKIDASFKDGVLTVEIARIEESKPQVVRIKS